jgi:elongation of very long chain fatty acids protein 6
VPEVFWIYRTQGFRAIVCDEEFLYGVIGNWSFLFTMSKIPELIDTLFIVLRKQPLIFLPGITIRPLWRFCMHLFIHSFIGS